ncbi:MAG: MCE family protein [Bacteroidales bacterium]|nr:MCE family protein [Bacteroidales bacterium]
MKKKKFSRELKIGFFSLIVIVFLYFTIQFLKGNDLFSGTNTYYAIYTNVWGLDPTSPVSVLGLTAGSVDNIQFDRESKKMVVKMRLKKDFPIPRGTVAEIYSADILGGKAVQLLLGSQEDMHSSGDTLASSIQHDLISMLTNDLGLLKDDISGLISSVELAVLDLTRLLSEENRDQVQDVLKHLNGSLKEINTFTKALNENKGTLDRIFTGADTLFLGLNKATVRLTATLEHFEGMASQWKDQDVAGVINGLKELLDQLNNPDGTLGQLTGDPQLYHAVTRVLHRADSLLHLMGENPKKYFKISVF